MKVSMYIVNKWLEKYSPEAHISNGEQEILGVRYFTEDTPRREFLYIGNNRDFIESGKGGVICANSGDIILLDTDDIYTVFNEMQEMLEFYNSWEMKIMRMIGENASVSGILEETADMLGYGLLLTDASHFILGEAKVSDEEYAQRRMDGRLSDGNILMANRILEEHLLEKHAFAAKWGREGSTYDIVRNFFDGDSVIGWLVVFEVDRPSDMQALLQLTESFSRLLEFWFRINAEKLMLNNQAGVFLDILQGKETDPRIISFRISGIGWSDHPEMILANLFFPDENSLNKAYILRHIPENFSDSYIFRFKDELLMIINISKTGDIYERQLNDLADRYGICIGLSYPFEDAEKLQQYYEQTVIALKYSGTKTGTVVHCGDYAVAYMKSVLRNSISTDVSHKGLDILKEYDALNNTDYYWTLAMYLYYERDQTRTAQVLHIHRNSLIYRVRKIREILDLDPDDDRNRFYLLMSFFLREKLFGM